ncbi:MAG TPA: alanine--tRNA ligase-related protein [Candidatus Saccharimonadales bacterium]|nr:alanine--tRNA ligase-related protein [Candidatus Saccharimonadales bacterium]
MESIRSTFLEYHRDEGFATHEPFPLVIEDPTVLFTNATITPFKPMFSGEVPFANFALVQRCLRLGGTGGTPESARTNPNYTSLFNMLGSGVFEIGHDEAVAYFVDMLDALGIERDKMIFSSIGGHDLNAALTESSLDAGQVRVFDNPDTLQHEWSFGEGDLHGRGVIAWFSEVGYDSTPALSDCIQIGRIVHIDGVSEDSGVRPFDYNAFDVGLGMSRVELALTGGNDDSMRSWRNLSSQFKTQFAGISDGDAHYMANLCCIVDELTAEGLMPGNKRHAYVLRKTIRSLIEETWLQSGDFVDIQETLGGFMEEAIDKAKVAESILSEEGALRRILSNVATTRAKNPGMTSEKLHATFGIKPSLLDLVQ